MAVAEAGRQAGVPPEELAKMYANTYNEVEKNMTGFKSKKAAALDEEGFYTVHPKDEDDDIQVYQRPWVGLTYEQKLDLISDAKGMGGKIRGDAQLIALLDEHEAKLKEKNT
jgi:hypothetical protein